MNIADFAKMDVVDFAEKYLGIKLYTYQKVILKALNKIGSKKDGKDWLYQYI